MKERSRLAISSAMHEELHALHAELEDARSIEMAGRRFHTGRLAGQPVVLALSGIGKVAAAVTATLLIREFDARALVFTGVAGGLDESVRVGDVVIARELLHHDMDASPLFPRFEVPLTGRSRFATDDDLTRSLVVAANDCLAHSAPLLDASRTLGLKPPRLHEGLIVSGDRFVASAAETAALRAVLPDARAVEMEGAAVAQVCTDFGRPFAVLRSISDRADDAAHVDFGRFIGEVASVYTHRIMLHWLGTMA